MIPFSILDLAPIAEGASAADALRNSLALAQHGEALGYRRFWLAEHHNMTGIASAATAVVVGHIAGGTRTLRVGAGGIMLPNHAPLVIAEQFGTLESLYPGRIDLGLGRAPGTDMATARALRRDLSRQDERFPQDVQELLHYFEPAQPGQAIRAVPGAGLKVPVWLLGSSLYSAQLAAVLGRPFSFASHFAPADLPHALELYRRRFTPSDALADPYAMPCISVFAADTDAEARRQFTSMQQVFTLRRRSGAGQLPPPIDDIEAFWRPNEKQSVEAALSRAIVGSAETVERGLRAFIAETRPNELMITGQFFDPAARLRSFEIVAQVRDKLAAEGG